MSEERLDRSALQRILPPDPTGTDPSVQEVWQRMDTVEEWRDQPVGAWPHERALPWGLRFLAEALEHLARHDLARLIHLERVALCRELDDLEALGGALSDLRRNLERQGRLEEAVLIAHEEREVHLRLVAIDPWSVEVANHARREITRMLAELGRHEDAAESAASALRELREQPERSRRPSIAYDLADAQNDLAASLVHLGRLEEAYEPTAAAVEFWRTHTDEQRPRCISTLNELGRRLVSIGRVEEGNAACAEAARISGMRT
ncbi:hypothetical protein FKR81_30375 [Lentzea tibetensis]|uniref:Tetratricopeptide repeat protein n=1 Tax=Lentzea tibetensis TaxID=2591470 RepID=A0A563ELB4_9PSEU|nr:hypothetical protein [Lentzea tibetensis]TWP47976.1 hypothetical protein FKR81_30375 [Lentzea tibetensis]